MIIFYAGIFLFSIYLLVLLFHPYWSFYIALVIKPILDMSYSKPIIYDLSLSKLLSVIFIVNLLIIALRDIERLKFIKSNWLVAIWLLFTASSFIVASLTDVISGLDNLFRYANFVLSFICIPLVVHRNEALFFKMLLVASIVPITITVMQMFGFNIGYYEATIADLLRPRGFFHDSFTNRLYFIYAMVASSYFLVNSKENLWRAASVVYFFVAVSCLYNLHSKSGFVIIALFVMTLIMSLRRSAKVIAIAVCFVIAVLLAGQVHNRLQMVYQKEIGFLAGKEKQERLFQGRVYSWEEELKKWSDSDFEDQMLGSGQQYRGMHNDFLRILFCNGIIGLIFFLFFLLYILILLLRNYIFDRTFLCLLSLVLLLTFVVDSVGLVPTLYPAYNWMVWGIVSYTLSRKLLNRSITNEAKHAC